MAPRSASRFRLRRLVPVGATLLVAAAVVGVAGGRGGKTLAPGMQLASGSGFTLSGTVSNLAPGVASTLVLTAGNTYNVPITVASVSVAVSSVTTACPVTYLSINGTAFTGTPPTAAITVNGSSVPALPASVPSPVPASGSATISLPIEVALGAPNACQTTTFNFTYAGSATYTEPTLTTLTAAPNPSNVGQSVTFTATVAANITPVSAAVTPVGSVTFYQCTNPATLASGSPASSCTTKAALSGAVAVNGSGQATYATSTLAVGSYPIFAVFTPTDSTSFAASSSTTLTQVVSLVYTSCITTTVNANLVVASGQSICITSTGKLNGNATVNSGGALYLLRGVINGNVTVNSGGAMTVTGGSINGNLTATGAKYLTVCGANKLNGNLTASATTGFVVIGDAEMTAVPAVRPTASTATSRSPPTPAGWSWAATPSTAT